MEKVIQLTETEQFVRRLLASQPKKGFINLDDNEVEAFLSLVKLGKVFGRLLKNRRELVDGSFYSTVKYHF